MRAANIRRLERKTAFRPALAGIRAFRWGAAPGLRENLRDEDEGCGSGANGTPNRVEAGPGRLGSREIGKRNALIRERYADGEAAEAIGRDCGLTKWKVWRICGERLSGQEREERNAEIRRRYAEGEARETLGEDYGISKWKIWRICRRVKREVEETGRPRPLGRQERGERNARIRERYANGEAQKAIAKDYGIAPSTVSGICKGMKGRHPRAKKERNARMRERYKGGETLAAIAKDYGLSKQTVATICSGIGARKMGPKHEMMMRERDKKPGTEAENARIRERFADGEAVAKIARDFRISQWIVFAVCRGMEVEDETRHKKVRERFADGEAVEAIAKDYWDCYSVYKICEGVERKAPQP